MSETWKYCLISEDSIVIVLSLMRSSRDRLTHSISSGNIDTSEIHYVNAAEEKRSLVLERSN